ncbi:LOW QUALITY PROTEIN: hypothetical protein PHMEG_00041348 [Phytophthora megakarya]|uniref:Uncharacterized protein n=1 Tax=Phytophthora megakarya TaxID=4795 RepID=A0A225UBU7_9STRA|nr:LOW QUALITY PROTEIN: hypothetical protein PHMEG_00041348 [Phytophthora megakarya]
MKTWGLTSTSPSPNTGHSIKRLLDAIPHARITKACLIEAAFQGDDAGEEEWVLPTGVDLNHMRTILDDVRVNGKTLFLTSCEPTLKPAENLPSNVIKKYRQRKRRKVERSYIEAEASEE